MFVFDKGVERRECGAEVTRTRPHKHTQKNTGNKTSPSLLVSLSLFSRQELLAPQQRAGAPELDQFARKAQQAGARVGRRVGGGGVPVHPAELAVVVAVPVVVALVRLRELVALI